MDPADRGAVSRGPGGSRRSEAGQSTYFPQDPAELAPVVSFRCPTGGRPDRSAEVDSQCARNLLSASEATFCSGRAQILQIMIHLSNCHAVIY